MTLRDLWEGAVAVWRWLWTGQAGAAIELLATLGGVWAALWLEGRRRRREELADTKERLRKVLAEARWNRAHIDELIAELNARWVTYTSLSTDAIRGALLHPASLTHLPVGLDAPLRSLALRLDEANARLQLHRRPITGGPTLSPHETIAFLEYLRDRLLAEMVIPSLEGVVGSERPEPSSAP